MSRTADSTGIDLQAITEGFFDAWGTSWSTFISSFDLFADECVWEQGPAPVCRSREDAVNLMVGAHHAGVETCTVEIRNLWVVANTVITERVDSMYRRDGSLAASAPVVGIMEYNQAGKLEHWREYFDSALLASLGQESPVP